MAHLRPKKTQNPPTFYVSLVISPFFYWCNKCPIQNQNTIREKLAIFLCQRSCRITSYAPTFFALFWLNFTLFSVVFFSINFTLFHVNLTLFCKLYTFSVKFTRFSVKLNFFPVQIALISVTFALFIANYTLFPVKIALSF